MSDSVASATPTVVSADGPLDGITAAVRLDLVGGGRHAALVPEDHNGDVVNHHRELVGPHLGTHVAEAGG